MVNLKLTSVCTVFLFLFNSNVFAEPCDGVQVNSCRKTIEGKCPNYIQKMVLSDLGSHMKVKYQNCKKDLNKECKPGRGDPTDFCQK